MSFKSLLKRLVVFVVLGALIFCYLILFIPYSKTGNPQVIDIPPGRTFYQVAEELESKKLISSAFYFKVLVRLFRTPPLFVGEYELSPATAIWFQFQKIRRGHVKMKWITFPEGLNHYEMSLLLKSQGWPHTREFLELVWDRKFIKTLLDESPPSLEGYLFPETYPISKYKKAESLLKEMVDEFLKVYQQVASQQSHSFSRNEVVTLASLIEKETGKGQERSLISSVFHNRLNRNMKLQSDPTILYSLFLKEGFERELSIRRKDILFSSPYNTYVVKRLPLGPIASPGRESLKAVFLPDKTDYLYFVSRNDGTHVFSKTLKEHNRAVYKYQIAPFKKKKP